MEKTEKPGFRSNLLITDVSMDPKLKVGIGGYLLVPAEILNAGPDGIDKTGVIEKLITKRFQGTSSTKLEVQTVLWALEENRHQMDISCSRKLLLCTDSQCVTGLLRRRPGLEENSFISKSKNREIDNSSLYRKYYQLHDQFDFEVMKVKGHSPSSSHDALERVFSIIDREVRKALRVWVSGM